MATLYVLIGLPGSGKSTWAKNYCHSHKNCLIVSSDFVRQQLFGDEAKQYDENFLKRKYKRTYCEMTESEKRHIGNTAVFSRVDARTRKLLKEGKDVIYDATSISEKSREKIIKSFSDAADKFVAVYFDTPLETCLRQNQKRKRHVPESVIRSMASRITKPAVTEKFDDVWIPETV